jgi:hypothetical protein
MSDGSTPDKDKFQFNWSAADGSGVVDFRDPVNGSASIRLCLYDASADTQPLMNAHVAAGGTCGLGNPRACWKQVGSSTHPKGYAYKDVAGARDGITAITLKAGTRTQIVVKGRGAMLALPSSLDALQLPLTVQLAISDSTTGFSCWQATFATANRQSATRFGAKGP